MQKVEIGRRQHLTFEDVKHSSSGEPESVLVSVELQDLTARREVAAHYGNGFDDLAVFFHDLASHWSGWEGAKSYRSLEGDLQLRAEHTGSHVELGFVLQDPSFPETWSVRSRITLDAGEELAQVTEALGEFFSYRG